MALYVYITPECEKDAKNHSRHKEMMRLKEKVEASQRMSLFDNFPPPPIQTVGPGLRAVRDTCTAIYSLESVDPAFSSDFHFLPHCVCDKKRKYTRLY